VMHLADEKLDLKNQLDNDMFNHISYVSNRVFMIVKKEGVHSDTLVEIGKYLWRLFRVIQAYNEKKRESSLTDIINVVSDFKSVFGG
jgi:hypothetical protein